MAATCPPRPARDTPKKITILKKQRPLAAVYLIILSSQLTLLKGGFLFHPSTGEPIVCFTLDRRYLQWSQRKQRVSKNSCQKVAF